MVSLQLLLASEICREPDYARGIERLFETQPGIVFLQQRIGEVSFDHMVKQVRTLIDWESATLVLLSDDLIVPYSVASRYDACFDLCLPLHKLSSQVQQWMQTAKRVTWKVPESATARPDVREPSVTSEMSAAKGATDRNECEGESFIPNGDGSPEGLRENPPALHAAAGDLKNPYAPRKSSGPTQACSSNEPPDATSWPLEPGPGNNRESCSRMPGSMISDQGKARARTPRAGSPGSRSIPATAAAQMVFPIAPPISAVYRILAQDRKPSRGFVIYATLVLCITLCLALWDFYTAR
jgi:hypothetical protein